MFPGVLWRSALVLRHSKYERLLISVVAATSWNRAGNSAWRAARETVT
jgi:hypothetical protein